MWTDDLVKCLEECKRTNRLIDAAHSLRDHHLPAKLYKYRSCSVNSQSNLETDTVWLSSPETYNDPFDCSMKILADRITTAIESSSVRRFVDTYGLHHLVSEQQILDAMANPKPLQTIQECLPPDIDGPTGSHPRQMLEHVHNNIVPQLIEHTTALLQTFPKTTKVASFSSAYDSILMWSHYAHNHTGFVMEYDLTTLPRSPGFAESLWPVIYSDQLYDLTPYVEDLVHGRRAELNIMFPLLSVLHKYSGWAYEREWRLVFFQPRLLPGRNFSVSTPTKLFLGAKTKEHEKQILMGICTKKNIEVHQMRLDDKHFQLISERIA